VIEEGEPQMCGCCGPVYVPREDREEKKAQVRGKERDPKPVPAETR